MYNKFLEPLLSSLSTAKNFIEFPVECNFTGGFCFSIISSSVIVVIQSSQKKSGPESLISNHHILALCYWLNADTINLNEILFGAYFKITL